MMRPFDSTGPLRQSEAAALGSLLFASFLEVHFGVHATITANERLALKRITANIA
jgi:hypothetical protein